jgi:channel protein (hemolysin III family)
MPQYPRSRVKVYGLLQPAALYSLGLVFHVCQRLRFQNAIWHAFVLLAAVCHYIAVVNSVGLLRV